MIGVQTQEDSDSYSLIYLYIMYSKQTLNLPRKIEREIILRPP